MGFVSVLSAQRVGASAAPRSPRRNATIAMPPRTAVAPRNRRFSSPSSPSFSVAALASEEVEEEDATPSDGEVLSTASPLLPSGSPAIAGALPAASSLFDGLKVLVVGATGRTGRQVVARLAAEDVPVRCLVRDVARARTVLPDSSAGGGVELVRGDLTQPSSLPLALADCNAVIWAAGVPSLVAMFKDPLAPLRVEAEGVANLVAVFERAVREKEEKKGFAAAAAAAVSAPPSPSPPRFVLISSIGADSVVAQLAFPGGVLFWKKRGELALQRSSVLDWTIIRPGGLKDGGGDSSSSSTSSSEGGVVAVGPDGIGFPSLFSSKGSSRPPRQRPGSISRKAVADLAVDALVVPAAVGKVVEVVSRKDAPRRGAAELFANAEQN